MKRCEQYQAYAAECLVHAERSEDEWTKLFLLDLAQRWTDLAGTFHAVHENVDPDAVEFDLFAPPHRYEGGIKKN